MKRIFIVSIVLLLILFLFVAQKSVITSTDSVHAQTTSTDWPMFMHDPEHSGSTPASFTPSMGTSRCQLTSTQDVSPCMQIRWQKSFNEWSNGLAQPIVVGTSVYFANMDGKLYAFDTNTGSQKWVFTADSGIYVTPALLENKIYFGTLKGTVYAVNASTGQQVFTISTNDRIMSSPTGVRENNILKIFIGSNDGNLYAINGDTGQILFTYASHTRAPIVSNPAYYNGTVFFGAEDMGAYAVNTSTGQLRWRKQLTGEMNRHDHPIVISASNTVLFYTIPLHGNTGMGLKDMYYTYGLQGGHGTPDGSAERPLDQLLLAYQQQVTNAEGKTKSMHLFQTATGDEVTSFSANGQNLSMIPLNIWYSNGQNYPLVSGGKDLIFSSFGGYIKLDTMSKQFSVLYDSQFIRGDEYNGIILANGSLYGGFYANIASLNISSSSRQQLHGCRDCGDPPPYKFFDYSPTQHHWDGYTGDGASDSGQYFIVAGGRAFQFINGTLYAF